MARAKVVSKSLLEEMRRAEERGREWAYHRERPFVATAIRDEVLRPMKESLDRLVFREGEKVRVVSPEKWDDFAMFAWELRKVVDIIADSMYDPFSRLYECTRTGVPIGECTSIDYDIKEDLKRVDKYAEKLFGRRCTWLLGVKEPYTFSALLNDLTACYHRVIDFIEKESFAKKEVEVFQEGKCRWYKGADERLVEMCRDWSAMTDWLNKLELYSENDYERLEGVVYDRRAEFTVGSSPGHKTHIDFEERELMYYDEDREVNENMKQLLEEHTGAECEVAEEDGVVYGVRCRWKKEWDEHVLENVPRVLAFATSMDLRIRDPLYYWPKALSEYVETETYADESVDRMYKVMSTFLKNCVSIHRQELEKELAELFL